MVERIIEFSARNHFIVFLLVFVDGVAEVKGGMIASRLSATDNGFYLLSYRR
jgi:hypothetical protein